MTHPANKSVFINSTTRVYFDVEESEILEELIVEGELVFDQTEAFQSYNSYTLRAKKIWIKGVLQIGTDTAPFEKIAKIVLYGEPGEDKLVVNSYTDVGSKTLAITGYGLFFGKQI